MFEIIKITPEMVTMAHKHQEKIKRTAALSRRPNYTALAENDRYFYGFLGELAFRQWLRENKFKHRHVVQEDGTPRKFQFECLIKTGALIRVNVSTCSKPEHRRLMMPAAKVLRHHADLYVGARLNLTTHFCELHGYIKNSVLKQQNPEEFGNHGVQTFAATFEHLQPMARLKENLVCDTSSRV